MLAQLVSNAESPEGEVPVNTEEVQLGPGKQAELLECWILLSFGAQAVRWEEVTG